MKFQGNLPPEKVRAVREWIAQRRALGTVKTVMRRVGITERQFRGIAYGNTYKEIR